jgi:hypothetical protein
MWLAFVGLKMPAVTEIWRLYLRRFAIDHWYRFAKNRLHWTVPAFSTPAQCDRWSDLMPTNQKFSIAHLLVHSIYSNAPLYSVLV